MSMLFCEFSEKQYSEKLISDFHKAFTIFYKDGDGTINAEELGTVFRLLGQNPTEAELQDKINVADPDGHGVVSFQAFLCMMAHMMKDKIIEEKLLELFNSWDKGGNGRLAAADLKGNLELELTEDEIDELIREFDKEENGHLYLEELVQLEI